MQGLSPDQWIPLAVIALVFVLRGRHVGRDRPFNHGRVWIMPALVLVFILSALVMRPPAGLGWAALAGGLALGAPLGWQRGRLTHIGRDPESGDLIIRHSAAALFLMVALVAARQVAREQLAHLGPGHGEMIALAGDALLGLAAGLIVAFRAELWLRARRILAEG